MTLPESIKHHHEDSKDHEEGDDAMSEDDDIFGPTRTILRRAKSKISMISSELRLREKRKRVLHLCLRKLERIKDSENNLRRSVIIHNTFSRLSKDIKRDKERGQKIHKQQQNYQNALPKSQTLPKKAEELNFDNLEELCSMDDGELPILNYDPILKNSEEIEQKVIEQRKVEVEKALLSYHQLEKRLKSDINIAFRDVSDDCLSQLHDTCSGNNGNLLNSFHTNMCSTAAAFDTTSNGIFQSLVIKSLET